MIISSWIIFLVQSVCCVGNGESTPFWYENWIAQHSLLARYPVLFARAHNHIINIAYAGFFHNSGWRWDLNNIFQEGVYVLSLAENYIVGSGLAERDGVVQELQQ